VVNKVSVKICCDRGKNAGLGSPGMCGWEAADRRGLSDFTDEWSVFHSDFLFPPLHFKTKAEMLQKPSQSGDSEWFVV